MELPRHLVARQDGVLSRAQLLDAGLGDYDIRRLVRHRELARLRPAVFLTHTGPPTRRQREWAAVLAVAPAALWGPSALGLDEVGAPIHVAVDRDRAVRPPAGVVLHRVTGLESRVLWNAGPPRMRVEEAAVDVAALASTPGAAFAALSDVVGARRTTPARLREVVAARGRLRHRALLLQLLDDVEHGVHSVLEREYLHRVERAHGLPRGRRQVRAGSGGGVVYRDVEYERQRLVVELDGQSHRTATEHDHDLDRDLDTAGTGRLTVRLGWGQVTVRPCATAARLDRLLRLRGWSGRARRCGRCPES